MTAPLNRLAGSTPVKHPELNRRYRLSHCKANPPISTTCSIYFARLAQRDRATAYEAEDEGSSPSPGFWRYCNLLCDKVGFLFIMLDPPEKHYSIDFRKVGKIVRISDNDLAR